MIILALLLATPSALTDTHQRDIACVVEIAVLADSQKRGNRSGRDIQADGKRWAGLVGSRIVEQSGQPRELVAFALTEAATARAAKPADEDRLAQCAAQMAFELATAAAASAPLPKPTMTR